MAKFMKNVLFIFTAFFLILAGCGNKQPVVQVEPVKDGAKPSESALVSQQEKVKSTESSSSSIASISATTSALETKAIGVYWANPQTVHILDLSNKIQQSIEPQIWNQEGVSCEVHESTNMMFIKASPRIHEIIANSFKPELQQVLFCPLESNINTNVPMIYGVYEIKSFSLSESACLKPDIIYDLKTEPLKYQTIEVITEYIYGRIAPETWKTKGNIRYAWVIGDHCYKENNKYSGPDVLVVWNYPDVHKQIERFLKSKLINVTYFEPPTLPPFVKDRLVMGFYWADMSLMSFENYIELIQAYIYPSSWKMEGSSIEVSNSLQLMLIVNTPAVHDAISQYFRKYLHCSLKYDLPTQPLEKNQELVIGIYQLKEMVPEIDGLENNYIGIQDAIRRKPLIAIQINALMEIIQVYIYPETMDHEGVSIDCIGDRIVIINYPQVQNAIREFLKSNLLDVQYYKLTDTKELDALRKRWGK